MYISGIETGGEGKIYIIVIMNL